MAPGYSQYNNYYDPVGSQANQSQGYSYQNQSAATSTAQPTTAAYSASQYPSYGAGSYGSSQQYGSATSGQQNDARAGSSATVSAAGVRTGQAGGHDTQSSAARSNSTQHHDTSAGSWGNPNYSASYNTSLQPSSRTQNNTSPQYPNSTPASTFGRLSYTAPTQQAQSGSATYNQQNYGQQSTAQSYAHATTSEASRPTYGIAQHHQPNTEPSRYASPLHAVQAQQQQQQSRQDTHGRQPSRSSNRQPSPVVNTRTPQTMNNHRQASASVEPANTTVDLSQVYDFRAEREKKAEAEAEKLRQLEEIEAAKKAKEARIAEEQRKAEEAVRQVEEAQRQAEEMKRQAEEKRVNKENQRAEQAKRRADEKTAAVKAAAKEEAERKKEEQRKARESKNAADTPASLATSSNMQEANNQPPPANDEEAEMRAMFQKMREFNSKNPAMLAKLWEEERRSHVVQSQSPQPPATAQSNAPVSKTNASKNAATTTPLSASTATPSQLSGGSTTGFGHHQTSAATVPHANVPQANTHLWPPGKKGLLAEIAAKWLHSVNPQRVVMTTEILKRLDMNPNYVQLCEGLEAMGLRFERAAFARELLRGIPPVGPNATNQTSPKVTEASIMSANGTVAQANGTVPLAAAIPKPKRSRATKAEMEQRRSLSLVGNSAKQAKRKDNGMVDYQMPSFSVPDNAHVNEYVTHMPEHQVMTSNQPPNMSPPQFPMSNDHSRQPSLSVQPKRRSVSGVQQGTPTPVGSAQPIEDMRPPSPPRQPVDKEDAARKRGFGDLVDLTTGDSDDEDLPPMKTMRTSQGPRASGPQQQHMQQPQQLHQSPQQPQQNHIQQNHMQQNGHFSKFKLPGSAVPSPGSAGSPFQTPGIPTNVQLYMQPNGGFGVAPPAVITAPAANMQEPITAPTTKTPTVPSSMPHQPIRRKGPTNEQLQHERVKGKMVVEPIMRDRVARRSTYDSRTIARDILLATGRHPDMRALNSHLNVMQKLLGDKGGMLDLTGNKSDLSTIKWDVLDPEPPKKVAILAKKQSDQQRIDVAKGVTQSTEVSGDGEDADDEEDLSSAAHVQKASSVAREGSVRDRSAFDLRTNVNADAVANNKPAKVPKKRGRPPRQSAPTGSGFQSINSPADSALTRLSGTPRQMSTQPQTTPSTAPAGRPVGYAQFRQFDANGNEIKKKGRPVGWRKSVHSREAQGLTPAKSASVKPKQLASRPASELQEPKYQVYKCHWLDCDAQLHSLEVLKKHVTKVHGRSDPENQYHCQWQGCKLKKENSSFDDILVWLAHVDKEHLQAIAWKLGDGPRGGLSDHQDSDLSEACLSDSLGRSVTPIIRPMSNIGLAPAMSQNMPPYPGRPAAGASKDERIAQQELQKLKERKITVGPTLEKTGVRLANEKRRMGFLDDENFEEIVESEGEGPEGEDH